MVSVKDLKIMQIQTRLIDVKKGHAKIRRTNHKKEEENNRKNMDEKTVLQKREKIHALKKGFGEERRQFKCIGGVIRFFSTEG